MFDLLWPLLRPLLFRLDPETAHHIALAGLGATRVAARLTGGGLPPGLECKVGPLTWAGPVGLAAGLDKDGEGVRTWEALGFGAIELGTVTGQAQPGNPRPRLFRLPPERAIINRMGFNNAGAEALAGRLRVLRGGGLWPRVPVGANVGKTKVVHNDEAVADYLRSLGFLEGLADYFVVNVSSPNTPGLRALQEREPLTRLLGAVVPAARGTPVFLKLAPDLEDDALAEGVEVAIEAGCAGIVATNTTLTRPGDTGRIGEAGGLSGPPLKPLAVAKIRVALAAAAGRVPVVGVGGVSSADDVRELLALGCAATQVYSAMIYEGPGFPRRLHRALAAGPRRLAAS
jgi:dihydroorotate dehydrogenase